MNQPQNRVKGRAPWEGGQQTIWVILTLRLAVQNLDLSVTPWNASALPLWACCTHSKEDWEWVVGRVGGDSCL